MREGACCALLQLDVWDSPPKSTLTANTVPHFFQPAGRSGPGEPLYTQSINPVTLCPLGIFRGMTPVSSPLFLPG